MSANFGRRNAGQRGLSGRCIITAAKLMCLMFLASGVGWGAFAQTAEPEVKTVTTEVLTNITLESLQRRIQTMGFDSTRGKDESGKDNTFVIFRAEGYKVLAFLPSPSTVELDTIFDDVHPTLDTLNQWNRDNRFSRAYIEKDGSIDLEDDLDLSAGVTSEGFEGFIKTFRDSVGRWAHFVVEHDDQKQPATATH